MARPKLVINPKRCERLKELIHENTTQQKLSVLTGISQQAISAMVNERANVTETTAREVLKHYPEYRFEWLMGYDDFKTTSEQISSITGSRHERAALIERLMELHGYKIVVDYVDPDTTLFTPEQLEEYNHTPYQEARYSIHAPNGTIRYFENYDEVSRIFSNISDYVEFQCYRCTKPLCTDYLSTRKG